MKITKLLELHRQSASEHSLKKNFGDGFLLKHNRIYRNIRNTALEHNYKLSDAPNIFYQALPYSQLEWILAKKTVPYLDNVTVLEQLASTHQDIVWDEVSDGLKKNHVFHEACHGVARTLAENALLEGPQLRTLQMLLEESFANTCELLAVVDASDAAHRIFYEANSYTALFAERSQLSAAMTEIGEEVMFRFMMLAYLHSNFLKSGLDERGFERSLALATAQAKTPLQAKQVKTLRALAKITFTLDLRFRTVTTSLHLKLSGIPLGHAALDFDFLKILETRAEWRELLDSWVRVVFGK